MVALHALEGGGFVRRGVHQTLQTDGGGGFEGVASEGTSFNGPGKWLSVVALGLTMADVVSGNGLQ